MQYWRHKIKQSDRMVMGRNICQRHNPKRIQKDLLVWLRGFLFLQMGSSLNAKITFPKLWFKVYTTIFSCSNLINDKENTKIFPFHFYGISTADVYSEVNSQKELQLFIVCHQCAKKGLPSRLKWYCSYFLGHSRSQACCGCPVKPSWCHVSEAICLPLKKDLCLRPCDMK